MKSTLNPKVAFAAHVSMQQLQETLLTIGHAAVEKVMTSLEGKSEDEQLLILKNFTSNPFDEVTQISMKLSNEYEDFKNQPEVIAQVEELKAQIDENPEAIVDILETLTDGGEPSKKKENLQ